VCFCVPPSFDLNENPKKYLLLGKKQRPARGRKHICGNSSRSPPLISCAGTPARSHARTKRNDFLVGAAALSPQPPMYTGSQGGVGQCRIGVRGDLGELLADLRCSWLFLGSYWPLLGYSWPLSGCSWPLPCLFVPYPFSRRSPCCCPFPFLLLYRAVTRTVGA